MYDERTSIITVDWQSGAFSASDTEDNSVFSSLAIGSDDLDPGSTT